MSPKTSSAFVEKMNTPLITTNTSKKMIEPDLTDRDNKNSIIKWSINKKNNNIHQNEQQLIQGKENKSTAK